MKKLIIAVAFILFAGVAFGQTLKKGGVVALHSYTISLAPGVTMEEYLDFWESSILPELNKVFPIKKARILKGIGVNNQDAFATLNYWESLEVFRTYWNDDGTPTEKGAAAMGTLQPIIEKMNKMGEYTQTPGDWLILTE